MKESGGGARAQDSSSDSDDDIDVVASAPPGYNFFEVDDKWPPAARYERPSTAAVPTIAAPNSVTQLQQVLPEALADEVYDFAVNKCSGKPWGGYLTAEDVTSEKQLANPDLQLARECVRALWLSAVPEKAPALFTKNEDDRSATAVRERILKSVHGFEVWVLTGSEGNRCDYHIDFAEFQRYQHNLIFFPLYSATIQVARASMTGGEFTAHAGALEHYGKVGYKGAHVGGAHKVEEQISTADAGWRKVPYAFNQSIIIDGTIPHLSTRVDRIEPRGAKRVIIATNVYDAVVGPRVRRFPIHSKQWQRVIKLNNILSKVSKSIAKNAAADAGASGPGSADHQPARAVGPYGEPLHAARGPRDGGPSSEESREPPQHMGGSGDDESAAVSPGAERKGVEGAGAGSCGAGFHRDAVETAVPLGHTRFSWLPAADATGDGGVPLSHTVFSWTRTSTHPKEL